MRNPHFFQKCCHFRWLCFDFSKNDNTFERNEDCASVFLKWTDFRKLWISLSLTAQRPMEWQEGSAWQASASPKFKVSTSGKKFGLYVWGYDNCISTFWKKLPLQNYFSEMHHQETLLSSLDFNQSVIIDNLTGLYCNEIQQFLFLP